jgi:hypothetical protein
MFGTTVTSPVAADVAEANVALSVYRIRADRTAFRRSVWAARSLEPGPHPEEGRQTHHDQDRKDHDHDHQLD